RAAAGHSAAARGKGAQETKDQRPKTKEFVRALVFGPWSLLHRPADAARSRGMGTSPARLCPGYDRAPCATMARPARSYARRGAAGAARPTPAWPAADRPGDRA